jgi:hypothetical protein
MDHGAKVGGEGQNRTVDTTMRGCARELARLERAARRWVDARLGLGA